MLTPRISRGQARGDFELRPWVFARPKQTYDDDLLRISYHVHEAKGMHFNSVTGADRDVLQLPPALPYVDGAEPKLPPPPPRMSKASRRAEATQDRPTRSASRAVSDSSRAVGAFEPLTENKKAPAVRFAVPKW